MRRSFALVTLGIASALALAACGGEDLVAPRLSVTVEGAGRVTSVPEGIDCPGRCVSYFPANVSIQLIATPEIESAASCLQLADAEQACGGTCGGPCVVRMDVDLTVGATFE